MTVDEMRQRKLEKGYSYVQLSKLSGVPLGTIQKIFCGATRNPRYDTLIALERVLDDGLILMDSAPASVTGGVKRQGEYTIDDYYALPDDQRAELIDGYIYDMGAPNWYHQRIAGEVYRQISNYIIEKGGDCVPGISPIDVRLDKDNKTMVQPDVIIVCHNDRVEKWGLFGAPDFALEVISPSTKRRDYTLKTAKYSEAGVREFWILDPYKKLLTVYYFEGNDFPIIYMLNEPVPVNIYNGNLKIDMSNISCWCDELNALED